MFPCWPQGPKLGRVPPDVHGCGGRLCEAEVCPPQPRPDGTPSLPFGRREADPAPGKPETYTSLPRRWSAGGARLPRRRWTYFRFTALIKPMQKTLRWRSNVSRCKFVLGCSGEGRCTLSVSCFYANHPRPRRKLPSGQLGRSGRPDEDIYPASMPSYIEKTREDGTNYGFMTWGFDPIRSLCRNTKLPPADLTATSKSHHLGSRQGLRNAHHQCTILFLVCDTLSRASRTILRSENEVSPGQSNTMALTRSEVCGAK